MDRRAVASENALVVEYDNPGTRFVAEENM
jgi:hypothetical protein